MKKTLNTKELNTINSMLKAVKEAVTIKEAVTLLNVYAMTKSKLQAIKAGLLRNVRTFVLTNNITRATNFNTLVLRETITSKEVNTIDKYNVILDDVKKMQVLKTAKSDLLLYVNTNSDFYKLKTELELLYCEIASGNASYNIKHQYESKLYQLGYAISYNLIKKLIDPQKSNITKLKTVSNNGFSNMIKELQLHLTLDKIKIDTQMYLLNSDNNTNELKYNDKGNVYFTDKNKKQIDLLISELSNSTYGNSIDLVHTAIISILDIFKNNYIVNDNDIYYIDYSTLKCKNVSIANMQLIYRNVRQYVEKNRAVQIEVNNQNQYSEKECTNLVGEKYYLKTAKYHDTIDLSNDKKDLYFDFYDTLIKQLTERQAIVLNYRLQGHGYKAIGTYLNVSHNCIIKHCKLIQNKVLDILQDKKFIDFANNIINIELAEKIDNMDNDNTALQIASFLELAKIAYNKAKTTHKAIEKANKKVLAVRKSNDIAIANNNKELEKVYTNSQKVNTSLDYSNNFNVTKVTKSVKFNDYLDFVTTCKKASYKELLQLVK